MKSVLISVKPKYCELIASHIKTVEVRKSRPKIETPFKCYIYCTKENKHYDLYINEKSAREVYGNFSRLRAGQDEVVETVSGFNTFISHGKVIGEFICDKIEIFEKSELGIKCKDFFALGKSCVEVKEMREYIGENKIAYGWHISDLKIYDKPKELNEFKKVCKDAYYSYGDWYCRDGYGSCAVRDKEKDFPYNDECIYFDCPTYGECCEYEDYAYCLCEGKKPVIKQPQSWFYVEDERYYDKTFNRR